MCLIVEQSRTATNSALWYLCHSHQSPNKSIYFIKVAVRGKFSLPNVRTIGWMLISRVYFKLISFIMMFSLRFPLHIEGWFCGTEIFLLSPVGAKIYGPWSAPRPHLYQDLCLNHLGYCVGWIGVCLGLSLMPCVLQRRSSAAFSSG